MKDKREGLSKEGSGRVAMYKTCGIIHSYTLEGCYASGRVMNTISPAVNTLNYKLSRPGDNCGGAISPALHSDVPPKFMPEHYADVGKALAIAALDIIEMNPNTRIPNTSFGSLEAIRNWIKFYIKSKNGGGGFIPPSSSSKAVPNSTNSTATGNEVSPVKKTNNQRFYLQQRLNKLAGAQTSKSTDLKGNQENVRSFNSKSNTNQTSFNIFTNETGEAGAKRSFTRPGYQQNKNTKPSTPDGNQKKLSQVSTGSQSAESQFKVCSPSSNQTEVTSPIFNTNKTNLRNNIRLIKDLEATTISNSGSNALNLSGCNNLIKKNVFYQNQLRLKIASRKSALRQIKGIDSTDMTIDYQKQEIIGVSVNEVEADQQQLEQLQDEAAKSKAKLSIRQLLPISKANIVQNNIRTNSSLYIANSAGSPNLNQNILFFNKLNPNGGLSKPNSAAANLNATGRPRSSKQTLDVAATSTDASTHHKKIILSSITRNSVRKYFKSNLVETNMEQNNTGQSKSELISHNDIEEAKDTNFPMRKSISLDKNQQKLLKKYTQSPNNLIDFVYTRELSSYKQKK